MVLDINLGTIASMSRCQINLEIGLLGIRMAINDAIIIGGFRKKAIRTHEMACMSRPGCTVQFILPLGLLGYWAHGLLGSWALGLSGPEQKDGINLIPS
jgi:hypothetical protein